jgi:hypothetical protein
MPTSPPSKPAPPPSPPVQSNYFSAVNGRIVPSGRRTLLRAATDRFTEPEQLALYKRYQEVAVPMNWRLDGTLPAEQWFELWQKVARAVSGRGVLNCIEFYVENKQNFDFRRLELLRR